MASTMSTARSPTHAVEGIRVSSGLVVAHPGVADVQAEAQLTHLHPQSIATAARDVPALLKHLVIASASPGTRA
jgi:hypothetical protein